MAVLDDGSNLSAKHRARLREIQDELRARLTVPLPPDVLLQQCRTCGVVKPISAFRKAGDNYLGLQVHCKACRSANRPHYEPVMEGEKHCPDCDTTKPVYLFPTCYNKLDGRERYCMACKDRRMQQWREERYPKPRDDIERIRRETTLHLAVELNLSPVPTENLKRCHQCGKVKTLKHFYAANRNRDGVANRCKDCITGRESTGAYV